MSHLHFGFNIDAPSGQLRVTKGRVSGDSSYLVTVTSRAGGEPRRSFLMDEILVQHSTNGLHEITCNTENPSENPTDFSGIFLWKAGNKSPYITQPMPTHEFEYCENVHGFLKIEQGLALYDLVMTGVDNPIVAEIGSYHGRSTCFLGFAIMARRGRLYSVDTFQNDAMTEGKLATFDYFKLNTEPVSSVVTPVIGKSSACVNQVPDDLDMLFIDGDHSLKGCARDLEIYFRKVRPNGTIVFHDYVDRSERKRVKSVVDYFCRCGMLTLLNVVNGMAVTRRNRSLAVVSSPRSLSGAKSIMSYLGGQGLNVFLTSTQGQNLTEEEQSFLTEITTSAADGIVAHNTLKIPEKHRHRCVLYALQSVKNSLSKRQDLVASITKAPYAAVFTNSRTLAKDLTALGLPAKVLYRPNSSIRCADYVPFSEDRAILWYWKPDHPPMGPYLDLIREAISELTDITIYTFPCDAAPVSSPNVIPLGRIDIPELCRKVRGLVRVSDPCDLGRSTFDVLTTGRFFVSLGMDEEFGYAAHDKTSLVSLIRRLMDEFTDEHGRELHHWARRFDAKALRSSFRIIWDSVGCNTQGDESTGAHAAGTESKPIASPPQELEVVEDGDDSTIYSLHKYIGPDGKFDYGMYKNVQVAGNKKKLRSVFAKEDNIRFISEELIKRMPHIERGICHGTRRGAEQAWFRKYLHADVIGTEISDTAESFPFTIQWDFHEVKPEWIDTFDFIYSNALDHSYDPQHCLTQWMRCLKPDGICVIEHTSMHRRSTKLDPFGADITHMPYLICMWGQGRYSVREILASPLADDERQTKFLFIKRE